MKAKVKIYSAFVFLLMMAILINYSMIGPTQNNSYKTNLCHWGEGTYSAGCETPTVDGPCPNESCCDPDPRE